MNCACLHLCLAIALATPQLCSADELPGGGAESSKRITRLTTNLRESTALVGVAKVDVTPDFPVRLNGYGGRRSESKGVEAKIFVRALAIGDDPQSAAVLLTVDNLGVRNEMVEEVARRLKKKLGLDPRRFTVTFTHTHAAPMLPGATATIFGSSLTAEEQAHINRYARQMTGWMEQAATEAIAHRAASRLAWGVGTVTFAKNRRAEKGPVDHDLPVLVVKGLDGKVRCVYTSYACHCVSLDHNLISGDWAGFAAESIETAFPKAVGMISIGCGADCNPDSLPAHRELQDARNQGDQICDEVRRLVDLPLKAIRGQVDVNYERIELPLEALPTRAQWKDRAKSADRYTSHHARVQLTKLDAGQQLVASVDYPVQTWRFGDDLTMVFLAGEVVVDYALRLKSELDASRVWIHGYSNDFPFYIPSERVLREGGYEGGAAQIFFDMPAKFAPGLEQKIVDAVHRLVPANFKATHHANRTGGTRPLSPPQSLTAIRTHADMIVDLVAAEPLVVDPVAIDFGADGRLWVAEMHDFPLGADGKSHSSGCVKSLTDTDQDGKYDESVVFLEDIPFPTGVAVWRDGILVCSSPNILYAEDTTGDGRADKVVKLFTGFNATNDQARVNGLRYGLDNWVYAACGLFGGSITSFQGTHAELHGSDLRCRPDSGAIEAVTGRTQQGRVRDDWDNWFGCTNSNLLRHYPLVERYARRNPHVASVVTSVEVPADPEPNRLFPIANQLVIFRDTGPPGYTTAACGIAIYRDELLGAQYYGNSFTCEPVSQCVHRLVLEPNGLTFAGRRAPDEQQSEFLASTDNWFRPVQAITGPDGALWIVDMYRYLIEHPPAIPAEVLAGIDVRAGETMGRIYRVYPKHHKPQPPARLDQLDTAGLVAALDSPNGTQRDLVQQLLVWRADKSAASLLAKLAKDSNRPQVRLQAMCTLEGLAILDADTVARCLGDEHPGVRRHAVRLSEKFLANRPQWTDRLLRMVDDLDPQVRLQLAYTLGESPQPTASAGLIALASGHRDDDLLQAAILSSVSSKNALTLLDALHRAPDQTPPLQLLKSLLDIADVQTSTPAQAKVLALLAADAQGAVAAWKFDILAKWLAMRKQRPVVGDRTADARATRQIDRLLAAAHEIAADENADNTTRIVAVRTLGYAKDTTGEERLLASLLTSHNSVEVQLAAVRQIAQVGSPNGPNELLVHWTTCAPATRSEVLDALVSRPNWTRELLAAVEAGKLRSSDLSAAQQQQLLAAENKDTRAMAERLLANTLGGDRKTLVDKYVAVASRGGDRERGKVLFEKNCAACHRLDGVGNMIGPDLGAMVDKPPQTIIAAILDPNGAVDPRYVSYQAITDDGRQFSGLLATETANSITLTGPDGKQQTILRANLEEFRSTGKSLMPEGFEKQITADQVRDLLAFLTRRNSLAKWVEGNKPRLVTAEANGEYVLAADKCEIYGPQLTFEPQFGNLGYWHTLLDHASWKVRINFDGDFDVLLDYSCANDARNSWRFETAGTILRGRSSMTGAWSNYRTENIGTLHLKVGEHTMTLRSDGPIRGALLDVRTIRLAPHQNPTTANPGKP